MDGIQSELMDSHEAKEPIDIKDDSHVLILRENSEDNYSAPNDSKRSNENKLEWNNITVYGPKKRKNLISKQISSRKLILENVSGSAKSYSMTALMGASGAGKTTLLNVLSGTMNSALKVYGRIKFNGKPVNIRDIASYVPQNDVFFSRLTISEHLKFNVEIYYGNSLSTKEKKDLMEEIIFKMNLVKCQNNQIGNPLRGFGISGGERKRLSLASELIRRPKIVFADEPTSGLDTFMASTIVSLLNELCDRGIIVLCVIHQPSSQIFNYFSQLYLMADGRNIFGGSLSLCRDIFIKVDLQCPTNFNPADHYIEMIAIQPENEDSCRKRIQIITDEWAKETGEKPFNLSTSENQLLQNTPPKFFTQKYPTRILRQFYLLFCRRLKTVAREPFITYIRVIQSVSIAIMIGLIYLQIEYKMSNNQSLLGVLFFLSTNHSFCTLFMVINAFPIELDVFRKEHNNRMYRSSVYFLQLTIMELPVMFLVTFLSTCITYWMIGLYPTAEAFFYHLLANYLVVLCSSAYGYFISSLAETVVAATILSAPMMMPLMIFGGFLIQKGRGPKYFIWIEYISWFKYGFEMLALTQYKDMKLECDDPLICQIRAVEEVDGLTVLQSFEFDIKNIPYDIMAMILIFVFFTLLSFSIIVLKTYLREK